MNKFLLKYKNIVTGCARITSMADVRFYLSGKNYIQILVSLIISILSSFIKILAPVAFGKAVAMIALGEKGSWLIGVDVNPAGLLCFCAITATWIQAENYLKKLLLHDIENQAFSGLSAQLTEKTHSLNLQDYMRLHREIAQSLLSVHNTCSQLSSEPVTTILPVFFDLIFGVSMLWSRFDKLIGLEFLSYAVFDIVLLNVVITAALSSDKKYLRYNKKLNSLLNHQYETLSYGETIRVFNHEHLENRITREQVKKYITVKREHTIADNIYNLLKLLPLIVASLILLNYINANRLILDNIDEFIFLLGYLPIFTLNMQRFNNAINAGLRALQSMDQIKKILNYKNDMIDNDHNSLRSEQSRSGTLAHIKHCQNSEQGCNNAQNLSAKDRHQFPIDPTLDMSMAEFAIEFQNVTFSYIPDQPILTNANLRVKSGAFIGIVGRSNVGKSTIAKLLYGFYQPQQGIIKINGNNINNISNATLKRLLCYVPQNAELFKERSLIYNVLYGSTNEELLVYLHKSKDKLDNDIMAKYTIIEKPCVNSQQGMHGVLNDDASSMEMEANAIFMDVMKKTEMVSHFKDNSSYKNNIIANCGLSGGQIQRVSIARALVRNSDIFIFDEATSALDGFTEADILLNLRKITQNKTTIMITHRLSTIKNADEIYVLENGSFVEHGNHQELLERRGLYYGYWQMQSVESHSRC
jgi:ABC-type multidrug transport system fused ATPase/permease subunit